jgi:hypothetical protein
VVAFRQPVVVHHVLPLAMPGMLTGKKIGLARAPDKAVPFRPIGETPSTHRPRPYARSTRAHPPPALPPPHTIHDADGPDACNRSGAL